MKSTFALLAIVSIACALGIYARYTYNQPDQNNLIVGIAAGYAPYISINEQGVYEGFDIDVAQTLANSLNKTLILKDLGSMAPLMLALEQGTIDMIIWGLTITPSRLQRLAMVHYQGENSTTNPLVFWREIPDNVTTLADMNGKTVCVEPASFQADILAGYTGITTLPTERVDDALLNLQYGKADAALLDPEIARKFQTIYDEINIIDIPLRKEEQALGVGIALNKENNELIDGVTSAIDQLKKDGTIQQLEQKWNMS